MYNVRSNFAVSPRSFSGLFDELFQNSINRSTEHNLHFPPVNVKEDEKGYAIEVVAPGLKKEDFKIQLDKNLLHISYEQQQPAATEGKEENGKWLRREFNMRSFKRTFTMNEKVETANISAAYKDGILNIMLPKTEQKEKLVRDIAIG